MSIKEYVFLKHVNRLEFNILINEYAKNDWELYGDIMLYERDTDTYIYGQAMVKI